MTPNTLDSQYKVTQATAEGFAMARKRYQKGTVYLRGTIWYGRYWKDVIEGGQRKRKNVCIRLGTKSDFPTKRLAMRALEPFLAEVNSPLYRARPSATFGQFSQRWAESVLPQLKPSTALNYKSMLNSRLLPYFGTLRLDQINSEVVQHFVTHSEGSPKTVRNVLMALRSIWKSAESWGYVTHDPFKGVQLPKRNPTERKCFSNPTDMRRVIEAANEPFKTLYWLAAETGLRAGELCGLQWRDVDSMEGRVFVRQAAWRGKLQAPKSERSVRVVRISEGLAKHLDSIRQQGHSDPMSLLFSTRNSTPLDPGLVVKRKLYPLLDRLGLPRVGLHAFRHMNATLAHSWGVPLKTMQERLGHSTPELTLGVYTHAVDSDEKIFASKLGEFFVSDSFTRGRKLVENTCLPSFTATKSVEYSGTKKNSEPKQAQTTIPAPAVAPANTGYLN